MPPGAKKRRAAKKKQEQASSNQINYTTKANNNDSLSSQENIKNLGSGEDDSIRIEKEPDLDERIEITDSSHDHDKSSSSSSHSSSSSSSSDDESREVKKSDDVETGDSTAEVTIVSSEVKQQVPTAGDAPFIGSTANMIVEDTGLIDSTMLGEINSGELTHVSSVDTNEAEEKSLLNSTEKPAKDDSPVSDEIMQASSGAIDSKVKEPEANHVPEGGKDTEAPISHEKEASVGPTHGIARRTSLFSCCGLFDVITGSSR